MRLLSGLLTLSSSVPGAIGPSFAEDVYGLNQFEHSKVPSNRSISDLAIGPSSSIHLFSKSPGVERCKFRNFQEWMIVELEDLWKNTKEHFFLGGGSCFVLGKAIPTSGYGEGNKTMFYIQTWNVQRYKPFHKKKTTTAPYHWRVKSAFGWASQEPQEQKDEVFWTCLCYLFRCCNASLMFRHVWKVRLTRSDDLWLPRLHVIQVYASNEL